MGGPRRSRFGGMLPGRSTTGHAPLRTELEMNTRTIAILALVIAVILVILIFAR